MINRPGKYLREVIYPSWDRTTFLPIDEMINVIGVAYELGITPRSVQAWQAKGWMPLRQQRGNELLYRRVDIAQVKATLTSGIQGYPKG